MSDERRPGPRQVDSFESSVRLVWGFSGALLIAATGSLFDGPRDSEFWFYAFLVVLIVTSYGQGFLAAAYNGLVSGLFLNFFVSQNEVLSFHAASDWWLELTFVAVGVVAGLVGRWMPRKSEKPLREPAPDPKEEGQRFLWNSRSSNGQSSHNKETSWTS